MDIITGISVGSLAAAAIAASPNASDPTGPGLPRLNSIWNSITSPNSIYIDGPLLSDLRSTINTLATTTALGLVAGATGLIGATGYPLAVPFPDAGMLLGLLTGAIASVVGLQGPAGAALSSIGTAVSNISSSALIPSVDALSAFFSSIPPLLQSIINNVSAPIQSQLSDIAMVCNQLLSDVNSVSTALEAAGGGVGILAILGDPTAIAAITAVFTAAGALVGSLATFVAALGAAAGTSLSIVIGLASALGVMLSAFSVCSRLPGR